MTPESLASTASLLYGDRWQTALSRALEVDARLVRRWADGERPIPAWVERALLSLLQKRIEDIFSEISKAIEKLSN